MSFYELLVG